MKMAGESSQDRRRRLARERKRRQRERQRSSEAVLAARAADALRRVGDETVQERQRRLGRERQRRRRQRQSASEAEAARVADALRRRERLAQENEYERELRRRKERERIALRRRNSSLAETEERRRIERERIAERRNNETYDATVQRRRKVAESMRRLRAGGARRMTPTRNTTSATMSSIDSFSPHAFLFQPTADTFWTEAGNQFDDQAFENEHHETMFHSGQLGIAGAQMQMQPHLQMDDRFLAPAQPGPKEKPRLRVKRVLTVADHQRGVMSSLVSLWKSGKLCDAGIGNGSSTVKVHKLVLSAVCPKLLSVSNMDKISHKFLQVNFPEEVSTEALNAFAEYMYKGTLDLDHVILKQLKIIAKRLDMEEFERLCDSHLPSHMRQSDSATATANAASFTDFPFIQTTMPSDLTSSCVSFGSNVSTNMQPAQSINTPVFDIKQEISEEELAQVNKDAAAMFGPESDVASVAPNESRNAADFVISPSIKIELISPEDYKYGHWSGGHCDQTLSSTTSSSLFPSIAAAATASTSIASDRASSTEFAIPFSDSKDVKSTKLKANHSYGAPLISDLFPVSGMVQTSSINEDSSKPLSQPLKSVPSAKLPNINDAVYPVRLSANEDNLSPLTMHSPDAMTVNSIIPSEKT